MLGGLIKKKHPREHHPNNENSHHSVNDFERMKIERKIYRPLARGQKEFSTFRASPSSEWRMFSCSSEHSKHEILF